MGQAYLHPRNTITGLPYSVSYQPCDCGFTPTVAGLRLRIRLSGEYSPFLIFYTMPTIAADGTITFELDSLFMELADGLYDGVIMQDDRTIGMVELIKGIRTPAGAAAVLPQCSR